jgi:O-antigen/teichoic acid export membrane protein
MNGGPTTAAMARGTLFAMASYAVALAVPLVSIPWSVARLGAKGYDLWVQLSILSLWLSHVDLGVWAGVARETADRRARGDTEGLRALYATWLRWDLAASAVLVAAVALCSPLIPAPPAAVLGLAVQSATLPVMRHFMYAIAGFQRIDLVHRVAVVVGPLSLGGMIGVLEAGWGITGLAAVGAASGLLQILAFAAVLRSLEYPVGWGPFRWVELRRLIVFGWKLEAWDLLWQVYRSDRLVLGRVGAPEGAVTTYQLGAAMSDRIAGSVTLLSASILPASADLAARGDVERLRTLFLRATKYHALAATLMLGFAAIFAEDLLLLWMGARYPDAALVLRIMAVGGWVFAVSSCAQSLTVGLGRAGRPLGCVLAGLGVAVLLYSAWGRRYHGAGLALSVSAGTAVGQVLLMIFLRGSVEFRWRELVGNAILKPMAAGLPLLGLWASRGFLPVPAGRLQALALLAPAFLAATVVAAAVARWTRAVDDYDLNVLRAALRRSPA